MESIGVYSGDPKNDPTARRYSTISYDKVIADDLKVMDQSAVLLARDHQIPIHVLISMRPG